MSRHRSAQQRGERGQEILEVSRGEWAACGRTHRVAFGYLGGGGAAAAHRAPGEAPGERRRLDGGAEGAGGGHLPPGSRRDPEISDPATPDCGGTGREQQGATGSTEEEGKRKANVPARPLPILSVVALARAALR